MHSEVKACFHAWSGGRCEVNEKRGGLLKEARTAIRIVSATREGHLAVHMC